MTKAVLSVSIFLFFLACSGQKTIADQPVSDEAIAFPGAEGFGKYATGGRGGKVYTVTNLDDDGEGSLRWCLSKGGPRTIVFAVSGTIHLLSPLKIGPFTTIAGQSAPGGGICIADHPVSLVGDHIIIRYMRFRLGDRYQDLGKVHGSGHDDALSVSGRKHIIIDHCSLSWSTDEVMSVYNGDSTTLQWNIISEPLNYSYHFEKGDDDYQRHGYGAIWGGRHFSAHHNLFAHCASRNPRFAGIRSIGSERVDFRNNVLYNWGHNTVYGGEGGEYNLVNNYYRSGPSTNKNVRARIVNPGRQKSPEIDYGKYYVAGNFVEDFPDVTSNNYLGMHMGNGGNEEDKKRAWVNQPFPVLELSVKPATDAYAAVLRHAGASLPLRDTLDERIISDVRNRTGRIIDVQGGFVHGTPWATSQTAWPTLKAGQSPVDKDGDGMPDEWERKMKLDPEDNSDAQGNRFHQHYTNLEIYLNSLIPQS